MKLSIFGNVSGTKICNVSFINIQIARIYNIISIDLLKLSSRASRKFGATGIGLKYLRYLSKGIKFFINTVVKKLTRKSGESWYTAARRWIGV